MSTAAALPAGLFVNVGSGPSACAGWLSVDGSWQAWFAGRPRLARLVARATGREVGHWDRGIVCHDVRRGLPLADDAAAVVYSSHLIEHLHRSDALELLRECRRVLAPGGVCRVVTPDLAVMVEEYRAARARGDERAADRLQDALLLHPASPVPAGRLLDAYRRRTRFHHHKWVFDAGSLAALFRDAGFADPRARGFLDSDIPAGALAGVEQADRVCGGAGLCVEARR